MNIKVVKGIMQSYIMINMKNDSLFGIALKDFDILMQEVNFFEKFIQESKDKQENIIKKIIISEMDDFKNTFTFNNEDSLKDYLKNDDNVFIFNTNDKALFYLNKNMEEKQILNNEILVELKKKIETISNQDNLFWNLNLIQGEKNEIRTHNDGIQRDVGQSRLQSENGIRSSRVVDKSVENRVNQSEEQFRYSNNKFYKRRDELPKSDDKNDKRRDQLVIIDLDKYYLSLKQVVNRLSTIYNMINTDTNFDYNKHSEFILDRAKLVSQYIYTNKELKETFEELAPKDLQDLLKSFIDKDDSAYIKSIEKIKENYQTSFKIYKNFRSSIMKKIIEQEETQNSILNAISFQEDVSCFTTLENIQNKNNSKNSQAILIQRKDGNISEVVLDTSEVHIAKQEAYKILQSIDDIDDVLNVSICLRDEYGNYDESDIVNINDILNDVIEQYHIQSNTNYKQKK